MQILSSHIQLDAPELPDQDPNKIKTRGDPVCCCFIFVSSFSQSPTTSHFLLLCFLHMQPAAFSLQIAHIEQWPLHRTFLKSIKKSRNNLTVSVHVSLFHLPSASFFGNTWQSREVEVAMKTIHDSGDAAFRACEVDMNEVVYWYTFVDDVRTAVVIELVASEYDVDEGVKVGSIGCGWTILNPSPFGHRGLLGGDDPIELSTLQLFTGTPRSLAICGVSTPRDLVASVIAGKLEGVEKWSKANLKYRVAHFPLLLKARHLIAENELVGCRDLVPGLVKRKVGDSPKVSSCLFNSLIVSFLFISVQIISLYRANERQCWGIAKWKLLMNQKLLFQRKEYMFQRGTSLSWRCQSAR
jgi:hypothetical protein